MAKQRLEAELGLNIQDFLSQLSKSKDAVGQFAGAIGKLAGAAIIFRELGNALKETTQGQHALNAATIAYKTMLQEIIHGRLANPATAMNNVAEMVQLQGKLNKVLQDNLFQNIKIAKYDKEISLARMDAVDATKSEADQLSALNRALSLHLEKKDILIRRLNEELNIVVRQLEKYPDRIKFQERFVQLMTQLTELQGVDLTQRRLTAEITERQVRAEKEHADQLERIAKLGGQLYEAFEKDKETEAEEQRKREEAKRIAGKYLSTGYLLEPLKGLEKVAGRKFVLPELSLDRTVQNRPDEIRLIALMNKELLRQQDIISGLADTFASYFSDINVGFQSMVDSLITGIQRMVTQLAAKAAFLAILGMIFPGLGILGSGAFSQMLFGDMSALGGFGMKREVPSPAVGGVKMPTSQFKIYGRDLATSLRRY